MKIIILGVLFLSVFALFEEDSPVFKLTSSNFKSQVLESDQPWLIQFYAPWCGHCQRSAPEFQKTAEILKGFVNVGAVDMTTDGEAGRPYGIQGYPTIKFFGLKKDKPIDYSSGERTFDKFVEFCMSKVKSQVSDRVQQVKNTIDGEL